MKRKSKTRKTSFKLRVAGKKKRRKISTNPFNFTAILKISTAVIILAVIVTVLFFLGKYVEKKVPVSQKMGLLELENPPSWLNDALKEKILSSAGAGDEDLKLDEDAAVSIQKNLESLVVWMDDIRVQTTHKSFVIKARWRKPLAMVKMGRKKRYLDSQLVILDYIPVDSLPIVEIKGLPSATRLTVPGEICQQKDIAAAMTILNMLDRRDRLKSSQKPLLYEIADIDVSNFEGRKNRTAPHIILHTTDNTKIIWGAEFGTWHRHLEATDEQKIAKLYGYYKEFGSLLNSVKFINLCDPKDNVPQPTDKY